MHNISNNEPIHTIFAPHTGRYMLSAVGAWQKQMWLIFVGYGFFAGVGLGSGYITPVSPLQKWFPDYKGMIEPIAYTRSSHMHVWLW